MSPGIPIRSFAAKALLWSTLLLVLAPIAVILHEADEHGAQDATHCACLVCHLTSHTPMNVEAEHLDLAVRGEVRFPCAPEFDVCRTLTLSFAVSGRSPPTV